MDAVNTICDIGHQIKKSTLLLLQEMFVAFGGVITQLEEAKMLGDLSDVVTFYNKHISRTVSIKSGR
jgi:hypothetical protein